MREELDNAAGELRNIYWHIRASRNLSDKRRHYRRAEKQKARLAGLGFDQELIRLYCLHLANPSREGRQNRGRDHASKMTQLSFDFG